MCWVAGLTMISRQSHEDETPARAVCLGLCDTHSSKCATSVVLLQEDYWPQTGQYLPLLSNVHLYSEGRLCQVLGWLHPKRA